MSYFGELGSLIGGALNQSLGTINGIQILALVVIIAFILFLIIRGAGLETSIVVIIPLLWLLYSSALLPVWVYAILVGLGSAVAIYYGLGRLFFR